MDAMTPRYQSGKDVTRHSWWMEQWWIVVTFNDKVARSCCSREPQRVMESYSADVACRVHRQQQCTNQFGNTCTCVRAWSRSMRTVRHLPRPSVNDPSFVQFHLNYTLLPVEVEAATYGTGERDHTSSSTGHSDARGPRPRQGQLPARPS